MTSALPQRLQLHGESLAGWLAAQGSLRLIVAMPGNIGDHLIWQGCCDLFERHQLEAERIVHLHALEAVHPGSTLVIPGSGALTRLWHDWLPRLILEAASRYRQVVILPSDYDVHIPVVAEALSLPNVWAFARQPLSYQAIKPFGRAVLMPDPALWCRRFHEPAAAAPPPLEPAAEPPLLLALRQDKGSSLAGLPWRPHRGLNRDLSRQASDLDAFFDAVAAAGQVVTDRLHIAVSALMFGKRLLYLDPYDRKISAYLDYAFDPQQREGCTRLSPADLLERGWLEPRES